MTAIKKLEHRFIEAVPSKLEAGILYVSLEYTTMMHLCCCGCGNEVVTPLNPNDWKMTFDGKSISVHPSVGNWSLPCQSHYVIKHGRVKWAGDWTKGQIAKGRERDRIRKVDQQIVRNELPKTELKQKIAYKSFWQKAWKWLGL